MLNNFNNTYLAHMYKTHKYDCRNYPVQVIRQLI